MARAKKDLDAKVYKLMAEVQERRAALTELERPRWVTSCRLILPGWDPINFQVEKDQTVLALCIGQLKQMHAEVLQVAEVMDMDIPTKWDGYAFPEWIADLKLRLRLLHKQEEWKKLQTLEEKLRPLLSEEQRRELALEEIEKQLD